MNTFQNVGLPFFTALGVVLGGSFIGSLASLFHTNSPLHTMLVIAQPIKLWAIVAGIGGTFTTIQVIDSTVWTGEIRLLLQQLTMVVSSFVGASVGYWIIVTIAGGE